MSDKLNQEAKAFFDETYLPRLADNNAMTISEIFKAGHASRDHEVFKLQADLKKAVEALEFYANEMNYSVDNYYGISGEMRKRCVLYKDCEERNDVYSYAGKLARSVIKELRGEK